MPTRTAKSAEPTQWLTVAEAAKYARCSQSLIYVAANKERTLSGVKLNPDNPKSPWRFTAKDIDAWLERGRINASGMAHSVGLSDRVPR